MLEKIIDLGGCSSDDVDYVNIHDYSITKIASAGYTPDALVEVMEKLRPRPEGRYVLLNALGAHEYWGINRNGDAFPEWSLKGEAPPKSVRDILKHKVAPKMPNWQIPVGRYGHSTFVTDAHVYVGHKNTDPAKAVGDVIASAYNDEMHRVELIVFIYRDRHPEAVRKIDAGEPLAFSMGAKLHFDTCLVPGSLISTPEGYIPIEELAVGDQVFTQQGNVQEVTRTFETPGDHNVVKIKAGGMGDALEVTDNHPVYVLRQEHARSCKGKVNGTNRRRHSFTFGNCKQCGITAEDLAQKAEFVRADQVNEGDYLLIPSVVSEANEEIPQDLAYVAGLYLGDGCFIYSKSKKYGRKAVGVSICCQDDKEYVEHVKQALEAVSDSPVHVHPAGSDRKAWNVQTCDQGLAAFLYGQCRAKKDKRIPPMVWSSSLDTKRALLAGLIDSDGSVDKKKLTARFSNTLENLVLGTQLLATSCGLTTTYYWTHAASGSYGKECTYGTVTLGTQATYELADHSFKCGLVDAVPRWSNKVLQMPGQCWVPVESIETGEYTGSVHNISVAEDETYLVNNLAVHNCSHCLAVARTRAEYCDHLRAMLGQTLPDGRKVFAYNFFPRFFDISEVGTPADRSAWALKKVASLHTLKAETRPLVKVAEVEKREIALGAGKSLGSTPLNPELLAFLRNKIKTQYCSTPEDPKLVEAVKGFKLKEILASLTSLGILLRPQEVTKLSSSNEEFPTHFSLEDVNTGLVRKLAAFVEKRSYYDPHFTKQSAAGGAVSHSGDSSFDKYEDYLKTLNFNKLAEWLDTNAAGKLSLRLDDYLLKVAGVAPSKETTPQWLPFFTAVSSFDYITN